VGEEMRHYITPIVNRRRRGVSSGMVGTITRLYER
jgi:hypothetical protein